MAQAYKALKIELTWMRKSPFALDYQDPLPFSLSLTGRGAGVRVIAIEGNSSLWKREVRRDFINVCHRICTD
jgi:hypothetical protein